MGSRVNLWKLLLAACGGSTALVGRLGAQTDGSREYHVARQIRLGGEGRWDYIVLDTATNRLFIARQDRVMVVDPDKGKLLGEVRGLDGAHGVALDYETNHGFATSGHDGTVVMFDLKTLQVLGRTDAADDADAILYDAASKRVFTFNGDAHSSTVIDPASGHAVGNIDLGGKPEFGVSSGGGKIFVNIEDRAELVEIDAAAQKVIRRWPLAPCTEPTGLAIDRAHHRLFSGCHNRVMVVSDAGRGRAIATVPIGSGVDGDAFDPATGMAFASNGEGTLSVIYQDAPGQYRALSTVPTQRGARTMALDPRTHRIYTVTAELGETPAPTAAQPHPRPALVPGTFTLLVLER
ncbi:MAG: YncE family protein [Gemmatimonadales bacterium]